jgi:hypothetical protein
MKVRAKLGKHGLETVREAVNGWHIRVLGLGQAGRSGLAALWAAKLFVPLIGHLATSIWGHPMTMSRIAAVQN